jgi:hypothetical protein
MKKTGGEPAIEERWTIPVSSSCSDAQHPQLNLNKKVNLFRGERKYIFLCPIVSTLIYFIPGYGSCYVSYYNSFISQYNS